MDTETIVMRDSNEAASIQTVTGWVSRNGTFFGEDERLARYDGSTHQKCETCPVIVDKHRLICDACQLVRNIEKYNLREKRVWDGVTMLYSEASDRYFGDESVLVGYCEEKGCTPESLRLVICEPRCAFELEPGDIYADLIAEDCDVYSIPDQIREAFDKLNEVIKTCEAPISWEPGKYAAQIASGERN